MTERQSDKDERARIRRRSMESNCQKCHGTLREFEAIGCGIPACPLKNATQAPSQSRSDALKPCPFCGSTIVNIWKSAPNEWEARCGGECGTYHGQSYETEEQMISAWNTRTPLPECGKRTESLVAELRQWSALWPANVQSQARNLLKEAADGLEQLERELAAARSTIGAWQPIETAPKDGTVILLRRSDDDLSGYARSTRSLKRYAIGYYKGWWVTGVPGGHSEGGGDHQFTNWMPLPAFVSASGRHDPLMAELPGLGGIDALKKD